jgi:spermidine/putrescine transport system substrate-binding protein
MSDIRGGATRRAVLKGSGLVAFGIGSVAILPFFGTDGAQQDPAECTAPDDSDADPRLIISNWPAYIDPIRKPTSTLNVFQEQTGITVDYTDDVNDNAEFFAKVRNQLGSCESIGRDMMMLTDWMAARMISLGWIQPLDAANVPNLHDNLINPLRDRQWDPDRNFSAPWQSGLTGIAYNAAKVDEVGSFSELLTRSDLKGRVTLLSEMRDTMGFMLRVVGANPDKFTPEQWDKAIDELAKVVASGQIRAFTGNEYIQDLTAGNIVACEAWSGDVIQAQFDNPDIKFVAPEEGLSLWSDNMLVPNLATHQRNAEEWINYYYEPEVAAKLASFIWYICPVKGAQEAMEKIDPSLVDNELIFPTDKTLSVTHAFAALDEKKRRGYEGAFTKVIGA